MLSDIRAKVKCFIQFWNSRLLLLESGGGGGATRSLPRDGGTEELHGDRAVGPSPKVRTL